MRTSIPHIWLQSNQNAGNFLKSAYRQRGVPRLDRAVQGPPALDEEARAGAGRETSLLGAGAQYARATQAMMPGSFSEAGTPPSADCRQRTLIDSAASRSSPSSPSTA